MKWLALLLLGFLLLIPTLSASASVELEIEWSHPIRSKLYIQAWITTPGPDLSRLDIQFEIWDWGDGNNTGRMYFDYEAVRNHTYGELDRTYNVTVTLFNVDDMPVASGMVVVDTFVGTEEEPHEWSEATIKQLSQLRTYMLLIPAIYLFFAYVAYRESPKTSSWKLRAMLGVASIVFVVTMWVGEEAWLLLLEALGVK